MFGWNDDTKRWAGRGVIIMYNEQVIPVIPPFPHPGQAPAVPPNQHKLIDVLRTRTNLHNVDRCAAVSRLQSARMNTN